MNGEVKLGGLPRPYDKRDFKLGSVQSPIPFPESFIQDVSQIKKLFQNGYPACGAHAGAHLKEIQEFLDTGKTQSLSPEFLWKEIKKIDGFKPEDGTSMGHIFKVLYNTGICDYDLLPNNYSQNLEQYTNPKEITNEMTDNAVPKKIKSYAYLEEPFAPDDIKRAIFQNKVVLFLMWVDDGFFGTTTPTFTQFKYGHFVVGIGYDKKNFYILDSTESDTTKAIKTVPIVSLSFIREVGTAIDLPTAVVQALLDQQKSLMQKLVSALKDKLSLLLAKRSG